MDSPGRGGRLSGQFTVTNLPALAAGLRLDTTQLQPQGVIAVVPSAAAPPTLTAPAKVGTHLVMQAATEPGFNYILEATPQVNPSAWTGIQTIPGGGTVKYTISITTTPPHRYFRLRVE